MFERLGRFVSRWPLPIAVVWIGVSILVHATSPDWTRVAQQGEFAFLPDDSRSKQAEELYRQAFHPQVEDADSDDNVPQYVLGSNVVIVIQREDRNDGLTGKDFRFVSSVLQPGLKAIELTTTNGYASGDQSAFVKEYIRPVVQDVQSAGDAPDEDDLAAAIGRLRGIGAEQAGDPPVVLPEDQRLASGVWTFNHRGVGPLFVSRDRKSTLVVVQVEAEFLDRSHMLLLERIQAFVDDVTQHRAEYPPELQVPANLELSISGSATVGRDMLDAERVSTQNTEKWTKILVILLLLAIYRAPLLVVIPLITVGLTTDLTVSLLRHMAIAGWIDVFSGLEIYVTVVVYGAGVDFCLFLISRYKEELDAGATFREAIISAIQRVGLALACSAGTSVAGIGMMMFARFGKFPQAGFAIAFGLCIVLCCALTLTPALLCLAKRWAFWPDVRRERISPQHGWIPASTAWGLLFQNPKWVRKIWDWIARVIERRPATVFGITLALMLPFAVLGVMNYNRLSYGLLSELQPDVTSVVGAEEVKDHFPAGMTGVTSVLLQHPDFEFDGTGGLSAGEDFAEALTDQLRSRSEELGLADIRSQADPLGTSRAGDIPRNALTRGFVRNHAQQEYVSTMGPLAGQVVRVDLVFDIDPFSRETIGRLERAEAAVHEALREIATSPPNDKPATQALYQSLPEQAKVLMLGSTASLRDLKQVTDRDRVVIAIMVTLAVYLVLVALLGRPAISLYLIATVLFSYLVTLGVTHTVYWSLSSGVYTGIDWKAPIFVFTILVAMGEDYNVLLMARVTEEQKTHGPVRGVLEALTRTGAIISSCGIIMAGTFASLMTGTLMGIIQLGFALSFGVLLDTFVVRPILVPSYLVLLYEGRFGKWGRWLGDDPESPPADAGSADGNSADATDAPPGREESSTAASADP